MPDLRVDAPQLRERTVELRSVRLAPGPGEVIEFVVPLLPTRGRIRISESGRPQQEADHGLTAFGTLELAQRGAELERLEAGEGPIPLEAGGTAGSG